MNVAIAKPLSAFESAEAQFGEIVSTLQSSGRRHVDLSELEKYLQGEAAELFRKLLQGHLDLRSEGHVESPVVGSDAVSRTDRHRRSREVESVFGTVTVDRERFHAAGVPGLAPLDAELNLPPERVSLSVRRRLAEEAARGSFDSAVETLEKTTGASVAKRQAEEAVERAAVDFEAFYRTRREAETFQEIREAPGSILVMTADGKGVPMKRDSLREATRKAAEVKKPKMVTRRSKGEKPHRKRMATVASVYTIKPHVRTPEDIIRGLRSVGGAASSSPEGVKPEPRPKPEYKRVWANVKDSVEHVIDEMVVEALTRDPTKRRVVVLLDGNEVQIGDVLVAAEEYKMDVTVILDFIHVLEYLWKAGTAFEQEGTPGLEEWVLERLLAILRGKASLVAGGIRRSATRRKLTATQRAPVDDCADYLLKYSAFMKYDEYLADGLPIATGVIEGACRYLVKDRMEITGARWSLDGAEAVLRLRSLRASGDFDEYWTFHELEEQSRNHLAQYMNKDVPKVQAPSDPKLRLVK